MSASKILRERRKMAKEVLDHMRTRRPWSMRSNCLVCGSQINSSCWITPDHVMIRHISKHSRDEMVTAMIREAME